MGYDDFFFGYSLIPWASIMFSFSNFTVQTLPQNLKGHQWWMKDGDVAERISPWFFPISMGLLYTEKQPWETTTRTISTPGETMVDWCNTGSFWQPLFNLSQQVGDSESTQPELFCFCCFWACSASLCMKQGAPDATKYGLNRRCTFPLVLLGTKPCVKRGFCIATFFF